MNRVKELRKKRGMSQQELSDILQMGRTTISKYENGVIPLSEKQIQQLTELFNVSADYLLGNSDNPAPPDKKKLTAIDNDELNFLLQQQGLDTTFSLLLQLNPEQRKRAEEHLRLLLLQQKVDLDNY